MSAPHIIGNQTVCPYCRAGFEPEDEVHPCPACGTPHHADCFAENRGCTIFGCTAAPAEDAPISVNPTDFTPPPIPANTSIYNFSAAVPPQPATALAPPPPIPAGSSAPPPPLVYQPYSAPPPNPYAYLSYVRPKSRVVFVLLAVFLGAVGAHNFYAGYNKKAVIQLCISLGTCFYASLISWIWAIVEACTVTVDDDGVKLT